MPALSEKWTKNIFFLAIIVCASGYVSPPFALLIGLAYGLTLVHPYTPETRILTKFLLQASVVLLGFGMDLQQVLRVGRSGFLYTAIGITFAMLLGLLLGRLLRVERVPSFLISAGTAICGGSAIAAIGPVVAANEEEMAVALGTVFILNSVALLLFPPVGAALHMSQSQFGLWGALAIHDTSSVVGACAKYGQQALQIGTTVKLARALWIVPLTLLTAGVWRKITAARTAASEEGQEEGQPKVKIAWPYFILFFCLAAVINTYAPWPRDLFPALSRLGKLGLTVVLFLIGTGISKETLRKVGVRPMLQGVLLWIIVGSLTLFAVLRGWIAI